MTRMSSFGEESHHAEVRFNRESRTFHDGERQVRVRPGAATIDQPGFRGQLRLRNQTATGKARQARGLSLITGKSLGGFESCAGGELCPQYQLLNRAGGLYSPPGRSPGS